MSEKSKVRAGGLSFGGALIRGIGLTIGATAALMLFPLASDIYRQGKEWLLWEPPQNGLN